MPTETMQVTDQEIENAEEVLLTRALNVITEAASDYICSVLEDDFGCSDEKMVSEILDAVQDDIQFHGAKVMERGYNDGRAEARAQFLIDDWSRNGSEDFDEIIFTVLKHNGFEPSLPNAKHILEKYGWPALDIIAKSLRSCDDIMPADLCSELDMAIGSTFAQAVKETMTEVEAA